MYTTVVSKASISSFYLCCYNRPAKAFPNSLIHEGDSHENEAVYKKSSILCPWPTEEKVKPNLTFILFSLSEESHNRVNLWKERVHNAAKHSSINAIIIIV